MTDTDPCIEDFTEASYRRFLQKAKERWEFSFFGDFERGGRRILWRRDVDFSLSRSLALASIEAEEGVRSTFFLMVNSWFYNLFEEENVAIVREIVEMGHEIGVHFSPGAYAKGDLMEWESHLGFEAEIFRRMLGVEPAAFSLHNPDVGPWLEMDADRLCGMVNTYGKRLKKSYRYCSDSNGYWRFDRLGDVLAEAEEGKLQVLTHPAWWVPEACMPRQRIQQVIDERATVTGERYDALLKSCGRRNVS